MTYRHHAISRAGRSLVVRHGVSEAVAAAVAAAPEPRLAAAGALLTVLGARSRWTLLHSVRVAGMAARFGTYLNIAPRPLERLVVGALVHDIGKITLPDGLLAKSGSLTADDWKRLHTHPAASAKIAVEAGLGDVAQIVRTHHEHYAGGGYPGGQPLRSAPLVCRVLPILDAYDAMCNARPYRDAVAIGHATTELTRCAGAQFDPTLVTQFCNWLVEPSQMPGKQALN